MPLYRFAFTSTRPANAATVLVVVAFLLVVAASSTDSGAKVVPSHAVAAPPSQLETLAQPFEYGTAVQTALSAGTYLWATVTWATPTTINRVYLAPTGNAATTPLQSVISFSDGSSDMLTPDAVGRVNVSLTPRRVTKATISLVSNIPGRVATTPPTIDNTGAAIGRGGGIAEASSGTAATLSDGAIAFGQIGATWSSAAGDGAPWAGIRYPSAREVSSAQLFGAPSGGAASWGDLVFSDGSKVRVTSVDGTGGQPTTIAFTSRVTTTVRYVPQSKGALTLREMVVAERGTTLPRLPVTGVTYSVPTPPADTGCNDNSSALGTVASGGLALVCPPVGATVSGTARVVVTGPAGATVRASAWVPSGTTDTAGSISTIGTSVVGSTGRTGITFATAPLPHGPFAIRITVDGSPPPGDRLLYLQLFNSGGVTIKPSGNAPGGATLAWSDDFSSGVPATQTGLGTVYGTLQPDPGGAGQFGDAVFADPALGAGTIGTLAGSTLRLRAMPSTGTDPTGWGRTMQAGLLSSGHQDGSGTLAQYGYFEVRALGAPGRGSWPAFWLFTGDAAVPRGATSSEIDVQEMFGYSPIYGCQTVHTYDLATKTQTASPTVCPHFGAGDGYSTDDWALRWHIYGVQVRPADVRYYLDGRLITEQTGYQISDEPYFAMLDEALGGGPPVQLSQTGDITDFYIDWIRVYS